MRLGSYLHQPPQPVWRSRQRLDLQYTFVELYAYHMSQHALIDNLSNSATDEMLKRKDLYRYIATLNYVAAMVCGSVAEWLGRSAIAGLGFITGRGFQPRSPR